MEHTVNISITGNSREEYHRKLIMLFLDEEHGTEDEVSSYNYYVETLHDPNQNRIYLKRPTQLNKGVDFEVRVDTINFRYGKHGNEISTGNRPSHDDIFNAIQAKIEANHEESLKLKALITKVYNCEEVPYEDTLFYDFQTDFSNELILVVLKWLFIEQDITYWNRSGRKMLYDGLMELWS